MTEECHVFPFSTILTLRYSRVYICTSNSSNVIFDLGKALIIPGFDIKTTLLKICVNCKTFSTMLEEIEILVSSIKYRISKILRYNLD